MFIRRRIGRVLLLVLVALSLSACQSFPFVKAQQEAAALPPVPVNTASGALEAGQGTDLAKSIAAATPREEEAALPVARDWQVTGSGKMIARPVAPKATGKAPVFSNKRDITLNFENTDIREVVKVILATPCSLATLSIPGCVAA